MANVTEVWQRNLEAEFEKIEALGWAPLVRYVAIDVEFPGFLRNTPRWASPEQRYADMKHSVDGLKPLQLGLTFCDVLGRPCPGATWQINLGDFDPAADRHGNCALVLVRRSGLDLLRNRRDGAPARLVGDLLWRKLLGGAGGRVGWVTFHGLYDVGYLLKLLGATPLPDTLRGFLGLVRAVLGPVYDVKHLARFSGDSRLTDEIGLLKMSRVLGVWFDGRAHQAGHDSLLAGLVFHTLKFDGAVDETEFAGVLYGLEVAEEEGEEVSGEPFGGFPSGARRCQCLDCVRGIGPAGPLYFSGLAL